MDYETQDYDVRDLDGVTVVGLKHASLTGVLEVSRIGDELKAMIEGGVKRLVVDFKHVEHCGSAGLGLLIGLHRKMQTAGGRMVLSHPESIEELLAISNTGALFDRAADPKVAARMFH